MAKKLESKVGTIKQPDTAIFEFVSDFRNIEKLLPQEQLKGWETDGQSAKIEAPMVGKINMQIIEKAPNKLVKITGNASNNLSFSFWLQLKATSNSETKVKLTLEPNLNPMMLTMVSSKLKDGLNKLVEQMEAFNFAV